MIIEEESVPTKSNGYRAAEDIFYIQFNDISFYIEDANQENFYHCILKNLFPEISIEKIFPLGGKDFVIAHSNSAPNNKDRVYLLDKDFDDLLNIVIEKDDLFYLNRYSIENYLIERDSYVQYIISEYPTLTLQNVNERLDIESILSNILNVLHDLILLHFVVQRKCRRLKNIAMSYERFVNYNEGTFSIRQDQVDIYRNQIMDELVKTDKRLTLEAQIVKAKKCLQVQNTSDIIQHFPGKYLLKMIKQVIESTFGIASRNFNSFCYRIAHNSNFEDLMFLKEDIELYLNE